MGCDDTREDIEEKILYARLERDQIRRQRNLLIDQLRVCTGEEYQPEPIPDYIDIEYIKEQKITTGSVFVTKNGKPVSRTNIWRDMKKLCKDANVNPEKVFPHNLRHLFARVFYSIEKDIAKLADILGHSSINTTRIYIISTGTEHRQRMENMRLVV